MTSIPNTCNIQELVNRDGLNPVDLCMFIENNEFRQRMEIILNRSSCMTMNRMSAVNLNSLAIKSEPKPL